MKHRIGKNIVSPSQVRIPDLLQYSSSLFMFAAESLIDKAIELKAIGGVYGNQKPTEFLCLLLKLLQIQPEKEILLEYLQADEFKYVPSIIQPQPPLMRCHFHQIPTSTSCILHTHDLPTSRSL